MTELHYKLSSGEALECLLKITLQVWREVFTIVGRLCADIPVKKMIFSVSSIVNKQYIASNIHKRLISYLDAQE